MPRPSTKPPKSGVERWDAAAEKVKAARGEWVPVFDGPKARNEKVKASLERRGLVVEVVSRMGRNDDERPWTGWRTFARVAD